MEAGKEKRFQILLMILIVVVVGILIALVVKSGAIPGLSKTVDKDKAEVIQNEKQENTISGTIYSDDGVVIAKSAPKKYGGATQKIYEERSYSSNVYTTMLAEAGAGLEIQYRDKLYDGEVEHKMSDGEIFYCGTDLYLTVNDTLQKKISRDIDGYPEASVVVMDDDGQIKAFVSSNEMSMDILNQNIASFHNGELINNNLESSACGSVLNPIVAELLIENGKNPQITDKGYIEIDGATIRNAGGVAYGKIDLEDALIYSSNQYFIQAALSLGALQIEEGFEQFGIGSSLKTGFCEVNSYARSPKSDYALANYVMGQDVLISPLQLVQVMQGIVTGEMAEPYIVKAVSKDGNKEQCDVKKEKKTVYIDDQARNKVCKMLKKCAASYGLNEVDDSVMAKTGTAENGDGSQNALLMASWKSDKRYYAVVRVRNTEMYGKDLAGIMKKTITATNNMKK